MLSYINSLFEYLQNLLGQLGVPVASRPLVAMMTLYLLITFLILVLLVYVWRSSRRKSDVSVDVVVSKTEPETMPSEQVVEVERPALMTEDAAAKPVTVVTDGGLI